MLVAYSTRRGEDARRRARADPESPEAALSALAARRRLGEELSEDLLAPLRGLETWNAASSGLQDLAIAELTRGLGTEFCLVSAEPYERGGARHRIAGFYHLPTGVELQLIPGERRRGLAPFLLGRYPLRRGELDEQSFAAQGARLPVCQNRLEDEVKRLPFLGDGFRLPSLAEWRWASEAGAGPSLPWLDRRGLLCAETGDGEPGDPLLRADFANAFGLVDLFGNVWELVRAELVEPVLERAGLYSEAYREVGAYSRFPIEERLYLLGGSARSTAAECRGLACEGTWQQLFWMDELRLCGLRVAKSLPRRSREDG